MIYPLVATDLDGTLLNCQHRIDPYTAHTFQQLACQGVQFVIATGRHVLDVEGIRKALGIRAYLITANGAWIHDPTGALIKKSTLDPAIAKALTHARYAQGSILNFYTDHGWLLNQPCEWILDMHQDSGFAYTVCDLTQHPSVGVAKVFYIGSPAHLLVLADKIKSDFGSTVTVTFSAPEYLEVMAPQVTKGHALVSILEQLDLDAADCIAFGDGQNDYEMLHTVGHPRLMANAHPELIARLPHAMQIASHQDSGVAQYLRAAFLLEDQSSASLTC